MTRIDINILRLVAGSHNGASDTVIAVQCMADDGYTGAVLDELVARGSLSRRKTRHTTQGPSYLARPALDIEINHYFITDAGRDELDRHG
jgi:hypothetical protein